MKIFIFFFGTVKLVESKLAPRLVSEQSAEFNSVNWLNKLNSWPTIYLFLSFENS